MDRERATTTTDEAVGQALIDAFPDPIVLFRLDDRGRWRMSHVNPAAEALAGYRSAEVEGLGPVQMLGPLTDPNLLSAAFDTLERGERLHQRVVLHRRDGSPVWCEVRAAVVGGFDPPLGFAHLRVEETAEGGRFRTLLENVTDTVAVLDADGTIRYVSPSVQFLGPVRPEDYLGTNFVKLLAPDFIDEHADFWPDMVRRPGVHGPLRLTLHGHGGETAPVEVVLNNRLEDPEIHGIVVTARNITDRLAADQIAAQMERRLRALVQYASDLVLVLDRSGRVTYTSPSVERLFGLRPDPAGDNGAFFKLLHVDDLPRVLGEIAGRLDVTGHAGLTEARLHGVGGEWQWFELAITNLLDDPDVAGYVINGRDVSERKRTEALLAGELSVLETMASSHTLTPVLRRMAEVADSLFVGAASTIGVMDDDGVIRHPASPTLAPAVVAALDVEPPSGRLGAQLRRADRLVCSDLASDPDWAAIAPAALGQGFAACWWVPVLGAASDDILGVVGVFHPVAREPLDEELPILDRIRHLAALALERGRFERRLEHQAVHDGLTGIPNRTLLLDRVERALHFGRVRSTYTAVLFIDVDRFKVVNDSLGHAAGDELLRQVARRLAAEVRPGDTVGRFGGDEFIVVLEDIGGEAGALDAARALLAALEDDLVVAGQPIRISVSIGVALAGPDTDDVGPDAMIRNADAAMYRAKDSGRARVWLFEETLHAEAVRRYERRPCSSS